MIRSKFELFFSFTASYGRQPSADLPPSALFYAEQEFDRISNNSFRSRHSTWNKNKKGDEAIENGQSLTNVNTAGPAGPKFGWMRGVLVKF